ncbi:Wadjet anti-phage system protein JetD domain-containing protein [Arthrobacter sp. CAN_A1]|uniref:Wadjet anti-phage system protein JetD domain-containing protein n=1 Tax=Arthrobacter sp. CAN_A1 TaxID=2787717 RepID=UPI0018C96598
MPTDSRWTTLAELRAQSVKAWGRGTLLRELLDPSGAYPRRRAVKKPTAAELRDSYAAARTWAREWFDADGDFTLETAEIGRTTIGTNLVPAAAVFARVEDEIAFAGKTRDSLRAQAVAEKLAAVDPVLHAWAANRPLELLRLGDSALLAARAAVWLAANPHPGIFVRQLSLPGVHTKFIERHRQTVDEMVIALRAREPIKDPASVQLSATDDDAALAVPDTVAADELLGAVQPRTPAARFARRHGFTHPPELVRFRLLDGRCLDNPGVDDQSADHLSAGLDLLGAARDITVTSEVFRTLNLPVDTVIVTENLVNFLSLPDRPGTMALFGAGYGVSAVRDASWLQDCAVFYWGDLDTHGFRILDLLRTVHPHVSSLLMDAETLLTHRAEWVTEASPARYEPVRLTPSESDLYRALRDNHYGPGVRLEQEVIRWDWVLDRLP